MKASDFSVGERVSDCDERTRKGRVISNDQHGDTHLVVEWDDGHITKEKVSYVDTVNTALEAEFDKMNQLLAQSALALQAAADLAKKHNKCLHELEYEGVNMNDFFTAFRNAGWRTSSLNC